MEDESGSLGMYDEIKDDFWPVLAICGLICLMFLGVGVLIGRATA